MKWVTVGLFLSLTAGTVQAQQIYKCVKANGATAYQQAPCGPSAKTKGVRSYTPVPDSKPQTYFPRRAEVPISIESDDAETIYQSPQALPEERRNSLDQNELKDQYGNKYVERPDSSFVRDKRTGKLCFTYGSEKQYVKCD